MNDLPGLLSSLRCMELPRARRDLLAQAAQRALALRRPGMLAGPSSAASEAAASAASSAAPSASSAAGGREEVRVAPSDGYAMRVSWGLFPPDFDEAHADPFVRTLTEAVRDHDALCRLWGAASSTEGLSDTLVKRVERLRRTAADAGEERQLLAQVLRARFGRWWPWELMQLHVEGIAPLSAAAFPVAPAPLCAARAWVEAVRAESTKGLQVEDATDTDHPEPGGEK